MKTINQAATQKVNALFWPHNKEDFRIMIHRTFVAGAAFAQRWIPVAEELPPQNTPVLVKDTKYQTTYKVLVWNGTIWIEEPLEEGKGYILKKETTYWRPVELK